MAKSGLDSSLRNATATRYCLKANTQRVFMIHRSGITSWSLKLGGPGLDPGLFLPVVPVPPPMNYFTFLNLSLFISTMRQSGYLPHRVVAMIKGNNKPVLCCGWHTAVFKGWLSSSLLPFMKIAKGERWGSSMMPQLLWLNKNLSFQDLIFSPPECAAELYRTKVTDVSDTTALDALPEEKIICCRSFKPGGYK